jgi:hypothetical protein
MNGSKGSSSLESMRFSDIRKTMTNFNQDSCLQAKIETGYFPNNNTAQNKTKQKKKG